MMSFSILIGIAVLVLLFLAALIGGIVFFVVRAQDKEPPRD